MAYVKYIMNMPITFTDVDFYTKYDDEEALDKFVKMVELHLRRSCDKRFVKFRKCIYD